MTQPVPVDVELVVVNYLRGNVDVAALLGDPAGVYTVVPKGAAGPFLRVVRIGGSPVRNVPLHLDAAALQIDAWGGSKADARRLAATALAALADLPTAPRTTGDPVVSAVRFLTTLRYDPDDQFEPARPRYTSDVEVLAHPARPA